MDQPRTTSATSTNGESTLHDLFAMSDEQILEIEPQPETTRGDSAALAERVPVSASSNAGSAAEPAATNHGLASTDHQLTGQTMGAQPQMAAPLEPPAWLAAQMKDAWGGEEAREFWDGVQQARSEAAAYRAAIASPEDARALKELYPGGVSEARAAAERGRLLEEIDRGYFGAAGNSPEQLSASRAQLAQRMLREDPAAFREMVVAGLQALQEAQQGSGNPANETNLPRLAQVFAESRSDRGVASQFGIGTSSAAGSPPTPSDAGPFEAQGKLKPGATSPSSGVGDAHVAAYAAFERAANEDLERSVGGAIERTLAQALPSLEQHNTPGQARRGEQAGSQHAAPLQQRLAQAVRQDIEKALQGDRQLGEQVAQILAARRFDNDTRAHIVRLIADRAQQLVPGAAKRVLNDWTQTTLAAHRGRTQRADSASPRADVALVYPEVSGRASVPAHPVGSEKASTRRQDAPRNSGQASATQRRTNPGNVIGPCGARNHDRQHVSARQSGASRASWLDRAIDIFKRQPGPPPKPATPPVHEAQWHKSVEQKHIVPDLTVHDVGLSVLGETRSLRDRPGSNESISVARQKIAQAMINDAELSHRTGKPRNTVHPPVEPSDKVLRNPEERAAYESSLHAAREAFLSGHDPTSGATHFNMRPRPDRSNWKFPNGTAEGLAVSTQSGPYDNSFPNRNAPAHTTWLNTYFPDTDDKKIRRKR